MQIKLIEKIRKIASKAESCQEIREIIVLCDNAITQDEIEVDNMAKASMVDPDCGYTDEEIEHLNKYYSK